MSGGTASDFNLYQCNPDTLNTTRTTCLPHDMLLRLRAAWNKTHPDHAIPATIRKKEALWQALREKMRKTYKCASEYCAVQKLGSTELKEETKTYFRPPPPAEWSAPATGKSKADTETQWHDTESIATVMEQYEKAIPSFEFIGPVPIDFDSQLPGSWGRCVVDELCNLDLAAIRRRGDTSVGIVFNLDPHDRPGSHWVCAYLDLIGGNAYYYDSYGYEPCPEIRRLLRRCREQGCRNIYWNDLRHQRKKTECGTYCMYILISLLKGKSFVDLCRNRVDDDTMNGIRDLLYATMDPRPEALREGPRVLLL
jgi:hypothetical protein